jgi:hypothetical protein
MDNDNIRSETTYGQLEYTGQNYDNIYGQRQYMNSDNIRSVRIYGQYTDSDNIQSIPMYDQ